MKKKLVIKDSKGVIKTIIMKDSNGNSKIYYPKRNSKGEYIKDAKGRVKFVNCYDEAVKKFGKKAADEHLRKINAYKDFAELEEKEYGINTDILFNNKR